MKPTKRQLQEQLDQGKTLKQIAGHFGKKSTSTAGNWVREYGLKPNRYVKYWTEEEDIILIENYPEHGYEYCGKILDRPKDSVYQRVKVLGINKAAEWKKVDKNTLVEEYLHNNKSILTIAKDMGFGFGVIYQALVLNGIKIDKKGKYYGKAHHAWTGYEDISGSHWRDIEYSARNRRGRQISFNITIEEAWDIYVQQNRKCALSGLDIQFSPTGGNRYDKTTASLDRIDSSEGYCVDNCQWVHKDINKMKMDLDQDRFIKLCNLVSHRK